MTRTHDLDLLKNLLFKVAECNKSYHEDTKKVSYYRDHEQYEHSSIFVDKHVFHSGDLKYEDLYGTLSTTLLLFTNTNICYMFERIYDHSK